MSEAAGERPRLDDVGVLAVVPYAWGPHWRSRQHILAGLAACFHVVWMDPPREWRAVLRHGDGSARNSSRGVCIYEPPRWLPQLYRPRLAAEWTARRRFRQAVRMLRRKGCKRIVLDLWLPHEEALALAEHDVSCYHITDEYTQSDVEQPLNGLERRVITGVDQVFILAPASMAKKGRLNPHTLRVQQGVDYAAFATPADEPPDLRAIPRPRLGYVGFLKKHLDLPLLLELARRHREWSFVFIGPEGHLGERAPVARELAAQPNVHCLGPRPQQALPAYYHALDAGILCYVRNGYTKFVNPLKLHECLAAGWPVVATPIRTLEDYDGVIALARTADEWSRALRDALAPDARSANRVEARREIARRHDWPRVVRPFAEAICDRLGPAYRARLEEANHQSPGEGTT